MEKFREPQIQKTSAEEILFNDFFEGNQAIKLLVHPSTGDIVMANLAACDFYGYSADKLASMNFFALNAVPSEETEHNLMIMKTGALRNLGAYHKCADGIIRQVSINSGVIHLREREYILVIIYDITGKRRAETAQQVSQTQFLTVLDSLDALVYVADLRSHIILFANRYMKQVFGDDIAGRCCWDVIHGFNGACSFCANEKLTLATVRRGEYKSRRNNLWYQSLDRAIVWIDGRAVRISISFDVTEQRKLEGEIISISERERIRIGHDLHDGVGQYFTGIGYLARMLKDKLTAANMQEADVAEEILSLIDEGKSHTRTLAKGLSPVQMDKLGIIAAVKELCMETNKIFQAECSFVFDKGISMPNNFIATHLYYIIREGVNNALRHGQAKHIDIIMKEAEDGMAVEIRDDGIGFDPDAVVRGLGLNLMKYRADVIGGSLKISKNRNGGATVACFLSAAQANKAEELNVD